MNLWGHLRLKKILSKYSTLLENSVDWPVVAQSSAVGVFGSDYDSWLKSHIVNSMSQEQEKKIKELPEFKFIFPTHKSHSQSYDANYGVTCLMYNHDSHLEQAWITNYLQ